MQIELRLITELPTVERYRLEAAVGDLDWRVSNVPNGQELAEMYVRRAPAAAWAVFLAGKPVGMFALIPYREIPGTWQTSTYLTQAARGNGVNVEVKRAVFTAARAIGFPLRSSIDRANTRSLAAAAKILDGYAPEFVWESKVQRHAYVYDLCAGHARLADGPDIDEGIVATISRGMDATLAPARQLRHD